MKANQEHNYAAWGYALMVLIIVTLAFALMVPQASISVAQEPTRPGPAPTRPGPGPGRETPVPPTSTPESTVTPGPTPSPGTGTSATTATPMPAVMPETGGADGGFILLLAGLAFTAVGIGASLVRRQRK